MCSLRFTLNSKLTWKEHVSNLYKCSNLLMYRLFDFHRSTNLELRKHLVMMLLFPVIDYSCLCGYFAGVSSTKVAEAGHFGNSFHLRFEERCLYHALQEGAGLANYLCGA